MERRVVFLFVFLQLFFSSSSADGVPCSSLNLQPGSPPPPGGCYRRSDLPSGEGSVVPEEFPRMVGKFSASKQHTMSLPGAVVVIGPDYLAGTTEIESLFTMSNVPDSTNVDLYSMLTLPPTANPILTFSSPVVKYTPGVTWALLEADDLLNWQGPIYLQAAPLLFPGYSNEFRIDLPPKTYAFDFLFMFDFFGGSPVVVSFFVTTSDGTVLEHDMTIAKGVDATYVGIFSTQTPLTLASVSIVVPAAMESPNDYGLAHFRISVDPAIVQHDPHIRTFDNLYMTAHGEGDYILAESHSTGLQLQGRFAKNHRGPWAPWTTAFALRCTTNESAFEVQASTLSSATLKTPAKSSAKLTRTGPHSLSVSCGNSGLTVHAQRARFHRMEFLNVIVAPPVSAQDVRGLLGTPNGIKHDDLITRDGKVFSPRIAKNHYIGAEAGPDINAVQDSWRVTDKERMFETLYMGSTVGPDKERSASLRTFSPTRARDSCVAGGVTGAENIAMCTYDISTTGSTQHVSEYVAFATFLSKTHTRARK